MVEAYNFIASWQLFPEKGSYESGMRPKSGTCKIFSTGNKKEITLSTSWLTLENQAFDSSYTIIADGEEHSFKDEDFADKVKANFIDALHFEIEFLKDKQTVLIIKKELMPNGYMKITQQASDKNGQQYTNIEIYHKQMSVVPYSTSVSGAVIKATEEGVIRHKALTAMEEQTNMQLDQIRKQIELLAIQAQEIQMRKELSMMIYNAKLSFVPVIGKIYFLYEKKDSTHTLSLISPKEYGSSAGPYKSYLAPVKLLADHTWLEV
jgi:hypothetical protein